MKDFQKYWPLLAKFAALVTGLIGTFLIQPPLLSAFSDDYEIWLHLSQFLLAIVIGLFFFEPKSDPAKRQRWRIVAICAAILGTGLFFLYQALVPLWSCGYVSTTVMVGATYLTDAANYMRDNPGTTCSQLIELAGGQTQLVWPFGEIVTRYVILSAVYSVALLSLSAAAMATVEYISAGRVKAPTPPGGGKAK